MIKGVFQYNSNPYMRIGQILDCFTRVISNAHTDALLATSPDINKPSWHRAEKTTTPHLTGILGEVTHLDSVLLYIPPHNNILYAI